MPHPPDRALRPAAWRARAAVAAIAAVVLMASPGCSGDDEPTPATGSSASGPRDTIHGGGSPDPTTNPALSTEPTIEVFEATVGACSDGTAPVEVTYSVPEATFVTFLLDDVQAPTAPGGTPGPESVADGRRTVEVPCDGAAHTLLLVAVGDDGRQSIQSRSVTTG